MCVQDHVRFDLPLTGRQFSNQPQRNGQFIKLEVRTKESHRPIDSRFTRDFRYVDSALHAADAQLWLLVKRNHRESHTW